MPTTDLPNSMEAALLKLLWCIAGSIVLVLGFLGLLLYIRRKGHLKLESPPPGLHPLDRTAYPHLLESVIALAPRESLLDLRKTSRDVRARTDARLYKHLVLEHTEPPDLISMGLLGVVGHLRVRHTHIVIRPVVGSDLPYWMRAANFVVRALHHPHFAKVNTASLAARTHARVIDIQQLHAPVHISQRMPHLRLVRQTVHGFRADPTLQEIRKSVLHMLHPAATVVRFVAPNAPVCGPFIVQGECKRVVLNVLHHPDAPSEALQFVKAKIPKQCNEVVLLLTRADVPRLNLGPVTGQHRGAMRLPFPLQIALYLTLFPLLTGRRRIIIAGAETWDPSWIPTEFNMNSGYYSESGWGVMTTTERVRMWLRTMVLRRHGPVAQYTWDRQANYITIEELRERIGDDELWPLILDEEATCS